ncbi:alpha/beta-hydrolase, partial [Dendrothele bispora CBS 962.96]
SSLPYTESWLPGPQSTQFYTRLYTSPSPKALLVFVHGFAEHVGRYDHIHPRFSEQGIAVFTFDQRGFGRTALDEKNRSKGSSWGKTGWSDQMEDIDFWLNYATKQVPGVPVFLMGHSMGGGEVLGFVTDTSSKYSNTTKLLNGVIAGSPLITQTYPAPKILRWIGAKASLITPYTLIPADVKIQNLSRDPAFNEAYAKDKYIKQTGSLRGVKDMLSMGEVLLNERWKQWPSNLPVLFIHGTDDKITSHDSTKTFHDKIQAQDKKFIAIPDAYHELQNEPNGVKEQMVEDVISFIDTHLS